MIQGSIFSHNSQGLCIWIHMIQGCCLQITNSAYMQVEGRWCLEKVAIEIRLERIAYLFPLVFISSCSVSHPANRCTAQSGKISFRCQPIAQNKVKGAARIHCFWLLRYFTMRNLNNGWLFCQLESQSYSIEAFHQAFIDYVQDTYLNWQEKFKQQKIVSSIYPSKSVSQCSLAMFLSVECHFAILHSFVIFATNLIVKLTEWSFSWVWQTPLDFHGK